MQISVNGKKNIDLEQKDSQWLLDNKLAEADIQWQSNGQASILLNNKSYVAQVEKIDKENKEVILKVNGERHVLSIKEDIDILLDKMGINLSAMQKAAPLKAPMPGMILKILVSPGQAVQKGDPLLILEAMKMENVLKSAGAGTVKAIKVEEKIAVEKGAILIEME
ncbi:MAG: biotin/lipoyl-binding protein [Chitinophagaceae bacterium]|nr:biotin/lipoyl-binding protein [Chitinophagaceae bacterium]